MLNMVCLVGRLVEDPTLKEFETGSKGAFVTLAVTKPFRGMDHNYEADFIRCVLWEGIAENTCEYCRKGDVVGIRGRLSIRSQEIVFNCDSVQHKKKINVIEVIAERVAFISTSKRVNENTMEAAYNNNQESN